MMNYTLIKHNIDQIFCIMNVLIEDMIIYIVEYLDDKNKLNFLSSSNYLHSLMKFTHFNKISYMAGKIYHLSYYDVFTHVVIDQKAKNECKMPKSVTHIYFDCFYNQTIKGYI